MTCRRSVHHHLYSVVAVFFFIFASSTALNLDGTLLLSFKYSILSDPLSVLENWNYNDINPCSWTGITCGQVGLSPADNFRVTSLVLPNSSLLGSIPEDLGLIQYLRTLDLSSNFMNGTLPGSLFNASELQVLSLSNNVISGELPKLIPGLKNLQVLNLSDNALAGKVPESLTSSQNLTVVSLRSNYFSGSVPSKFQSVEVLDLSSNMFNGSLPLEFDGEHLQYLNLSYNKFSGPFPLDFTKKLPVNVSIDLSFNNLTGEILQSSALSNQKPESFLGNADLCGKPLKKICSISSTLTTPPNITTANNSAPAIAAIPRDFNSSPSSNQNQNQKQHGLKPGTIATIIVADLAGLGLLVMILLYVYQVKKKKQKDISNASYDKKGPAPSISSAVGAGTSFEISKFGPKCGEWSCTSLTASEDMSGSESEDHKKLSNINAEEIKKYAMEKSLVIVDGETKLEAETLLRASAYILGSSGGSIVYKAVLEDGVVFAVRRIGESGVEKLKEFETQVKAISKLRHPNLVTVRGFYWGEDEKLLISDYISNGSLASAGHKRFGSSPSHLPFQVRLNIARGIARGLAYIHDKKHVHSNIKPSNILLTTDMEPVISDLGLHWLISGKHKYKTDCSTRHFGSKRCTSSSEGPQDHPSSSSPYIEPNGFMGCTSPYHAPESLKSLKPNPKWDVYSYGIVLLELLTGKVFSDRELSQWTGGLHDVDRNRVLMMADVAIRGDVGGREDAMWACFKLGFSCASLVPQKRPCMKDAVQVLEKIVAASSRC
ncbi:hypothetical protein DCAR_0624179 [Daucus carota subsp. sativus]|nr:hypothetical protein DCAR_0624179 [Daucus carota subsp. sativus]